MKKIIILTLVFCLAITTLATSQNNTYVNKKGKTQLIGKCTKDAFQQKDFKEWYNKQYIDYQVDTKLLKRVKRKTKGITFEIFMATWCGDSRREVPRFLKVLDVLKVDDDAISIINTDDSNGEYKQSPTHEEKGKLIHRVPTFIVYKDGVEIGRIVESPITSLEMDLVQILLGLPTTPNYKVVNELDELFTTNGIPDNNDSLLVYARKIIHASKNSREINTYAYVLLYSNEVDKAIAAFIINTMIYDEAAVYNSLGDAYEEKGDNVLALKMYNIALGIDSENKTAKKRIEALKE